MCYKRPWRYVGPTTEMQAKANRHVATHHTHDDLEFKTHEPKSLFDEILRHLESLRNEPADTSIARAAPAESITDQIKKLGELRDVGLLTDDEFHTKKAELLARL